MSCGASTASRWSISAGPETSAAAGENDRAWIYWLLLGWNRCIEQALKLRLVLDGLRLSREKAEAVLRSFDLTDLSLQPTPAGWTGTAIPQGGGYRMRVTVDRQGVMQLEPDGCRC